MADDSDEVQHPTDTFERSGFQAPEPAPVRDFGPVSITKKPAIGDMVDYRLLETEGNGGSIEGSETQPARVNEVFEEDGMTVRLYVVPPSSPRSGFGGPQRVPHGPERGQWLWPGEGAE